MDKGFTKEQLAMARQLQASFGSKSMYATRTTPSQGQNTGRWSVPPPATRSPPTMQLSMSQSGSALRTSNGLVRPLPSKAPVTSSASIPKTPVKSVPKLATAQAILKPVPTLSVTKAVPQPAPAPVQPAPKTVPKQTPSQPTIQPAAQPALKPTNPPAAVKPASQPFSVPLPVTAPPKAPLVDLMSMDPLPMISIPTLVAQPARLCPEVKMGGCDAPPPVPSVPSVPSITSIPSAPSVQNAASAAPEVKMAQDEDKFADVNEGVHDAMKINKMGKPILWNYMTEAPAVRDLSPGELEAMEPLPPVDNTRWVRPWHMGQAPPFAPNGEEIQGSSVPQAPRPIIGLKGSRHAR